MNARPACFLLSLSWLVACWAGLGLPTCHIAFAEEFEPGFLPVDSDLARWHSGQVYFDGQWRHIEQVQQLVCTDPRWQQYRQLVDASDGSLQSHVDIAFWCQRHGLVHEERLHWLYALQADPEHRGAMKGLQLMRFQGQLYPIAEVSQLKQQAKAARQALQEYKPYFLSLRRAAQLGSETERAAAFGQLAAVTDPAAIPALVEVTELEFGEADTPPDKIASSGGDSFEIKLQRSAVAALANINAHEATLKLLEIAVMSPYAEIRRIAAEALIPREKTSYMPLLMASLAAPLEADISIDVTPIGMVLVSEHVEETGPEAKWVDHRSTNYLRAIYNPRRHSFWVNHALNRRNAATRVQRTLANVAATNESRYQWNARINEVLQTTTGESSSSDPEQWWDYWKDYNEISYPDELPTYETCRHDDDVRYAMGMSCFAAGTPVWTMSGPVPIESIQVDDLVLSQDPVTGRLDYRPVLQTTVRPPSPSTELVVDGETIVSTRGHRFWVIGNGWRMAKHLHDGDQLHGASASSLLTNVAEGREIEAYNLVVGEFHTYFVGNSRLLVHDNGCPAPTASAAPGIERPLMADR